MLISVKRLIHRVVDMPVHKGLRGTDPCVEGRPIRQDTVIGRVRVRFSSPG